FCLSSDGIKTSADFWNNLRKAINHGLPENEALKALTVTPANLAGYATQTGTLEEGKYASFVVYSKNPFQENAQVLASWSMGEQTVINASTTDNIAGKYNLILDDHKYKIDITGGPEKYKGKLNYSLKIDDI